MQTPMPPITGATPTLRKDRTFTTVLTDWHIVAPLGADFEESLLILQKNSEDCIQDTQTV